MYQCSVYPCQQEQQLNLVGHLFIYAEQIVLNFNLTATKTLALTMLQLIYRPTPTPKTAAAGDLLHMHACLHTVGVAGMRSPTLLRCLLSATVKRGGFGQFLNFKFINILASCVRKQSERHYILRLINKWSKSPGFTVPCPPHRTSCT